MESKVGKVSRIVIYPVKSMRGIEVQEAELTVQGLYQGNIRDRHWVVVTESGITITGRQKPRITLIQPSFHGDMMHLDAEGAETLKVPVDVSTADVTTFDFRGEEAVGIDCGQEAGQWLSKFLDKEGLRLLYAAPGLKRRHLQDRADFGHLVGPEDEVAYPDKCPTNMAAEVSMQELNGRLNKAIDISQFRPNIILGDTKEPFAEDHWKTISIGDSHCGLSQVMLCSRCIFTTVNPQTGSKDPNEEPLRTLRQYRNVVPEFGDKPCFGVQLRTKKSGRIRVGDSITTS